MVERNIFRGVNSIKFNLQFKTESDCLEYLSAIKWLDGYQCKRCQNDKFCIGKSHKIDVVLNVGMMKVRQQERCLRN